jgi:hypothetical protein
VVLTAQRNSGWPTCFLSRHHKLPPQIDDQNSQHQTRKLQRLYSLSIGLSVMDDAVLKTVPSAVHR